MKVINKIFLIILFFVYGNQCSDKNSWWIETWDGVVKWIKNNPIYFILALLGGAIGVLKIIKSNKQLSTEHKGKGDIKKLNENATIKKQPKEDISRINDIKKYLEYYVGKEYDQINSNYKKEAPGKLDSVWIEKGNIALKEFGIHNGFFEKVIDLKPYAEYLFTLRIKKVFEHIDSKIKKEIENNSIEIEKMMEKINTERAGDIINTLEYFNITIYFLILEVLNNILTEKVNNIIENKRVKI